MSKRIVVTETRIFTYDPNLKDDVYRENGISDIDQALLFDRQDYLDGGMELSEVDEKPTVNTEWQIIEVEEEDVQTATEPD